jgi:hypothetical protein
LDKASSIRQRTGNFDPSTYHDRYQEALQQLIEAKMKGVTIEPRTVSTPSPVIDLMAALKRGLAQERLLGSLFGDSPNAVDRRYLETNSGNSSGRSSSCAARAVRTTDNGARRIYGGD